jgi:pre-rRNA-processing protein IPI3
MLGATGTGKKDDWSIMEIKPLERMRAGRVAREVQECTIVLGRRTDERVRQIVNKNSDSGSTVPLAVTNGGTVTESSSDRVAELEAENKRLKSSLDKAVKLNEKMWSGIVDLRLAEPPST